MYPDKYIIGKVFEINSIEDAFKSKAYKSLMDEAQKRYKDSCENCDYWDFCRGGCNASSIEIHGTAETVNPFTCNYFKLQFNGIYDILRNVDINDKNLNPIARKIMMDNGFYSVKEIKRLIKELDINVKLRYNPKKLFDCSEYKVFRAINYIKDGTIKYARHIDFVEGYDENKMIKRRNLNSRRRDLINYLKEVGNDALKNK
jgi:radical SAM protein with 4Fe4S-binding SPASM domain